MSATANVLKQLSLSRRAFDSPFVRNFAVVMSGTIVAQAIGLVITPVITRLYSPADFGLFGAFNAILSIVGAVITLQYSEAIVLPKQDSDAAGLFAASCLSTVLITVLLIALLLVFPRLLSGLRTDQGFHWAISLVLLAGLTTGFSQALKTWCVRRKAFSRTAKSQVIRTVCSSATQVIGGLGKAGYYGLVGGSLIGDVAGSVTLIRQNSRDDWGLLRHAFNWAHIKRMAHEYKDFPFFSMPQNLLNAFSQGIPVLLFARYFSPAVAGSYALAIRILQVPMALIINSMRQVLLQKVTEVHNQNRPLWPLYYKSTCALLLIVVAPATLCVLLAPVVFAWLFGQEWLLAGECARWLILWVAAMICNVPSTILARVLRQQRNLLFYDIALTVVRTTGLVVGAQFLTALQCVLVFSLVGLVFNVFYIGWIARLVRIHDQEFTQ